jgi:hypothetical protein
MIVMTVIPITMIVITEITIDLVAGIMTVSYMMITGHIIIVEGTKNVILIKLYVEHRIWSCEGW